MVTIRRCVGVQRKFVYHSDAADPRYRDLLKPIEISFNKIEKNENKTKLGNLLKFNMKILLFGNT